jgi:GNAT superfamily N-acetyltransferase
MAARTFTVERMQPTEKRAVVASLARAFYDDPLFGYFMPDLITQSRGMLHFMLGAVADAQPFGEVWVARTGGTIASSAVWLPPGAYPRNLQRELMTNLRAGPAYLRTGRRLAGAFRLLGALDRAHHEIEEPHFYLAILGTDPLHQRVGAGAAALRPVLDRCDTEGLHTYLETQKEENLAYYARHSFELVQKVELKGLPPVWTLLRAPRQ